MPTVPRFRKAGALVDAGHSRAEPCTMAGNKTRQGYAPRSTLKPAGYFFVRDAS